MSSIVGPKFLERLRSNDFKSSAYAMAEIVDNSVDAGAKSVEIIIQASTVGTKEFIESISFVDDGSGIKHEMLEKVVVFSETGNSPGGGKTGRFGMGLPNSSLSQTKKFIVASQQNGDWSQIKIDLNHMLELGTLDVPPSSLDIDEGIRSIFTELTRLENPRTIVQWISPDKLDLVRSDTALKRIEPLLGRIYRHAIKDGLHLEVLIYRDGNKIPDRNKIRPYDPLFLSTGTMQIVDDILDTIAKNPQGDHPNKSPSEVLSGYINNKSITKPLFREVEEYCHDELKVTFNDKEYRFKMTTTIATKDCQKPAMSTPGNTVFGKAIRKKMKGTSNFPGGNISWVRNGREIESGNYSLFNTTTETQRWWSIEISYSTEGDDDNIMDELLGLSHTKQSLKFRAVDKEDQVEISSFKNLVFARQALFSLFTIEFNAAIKECNSLLKKQAKHYKSEIEDDDEETPVPGPGVNTGQRITKAVLIDALGKGAALSEEEQQELTKKLSKYLVSVPLANIKYAVKKFSDIGIKNIPIYCSLEKSKLFRAQKFQGRLLTLINIDHPFYEKIIEPLKENHKEITASIELLFSALSKEEISGNESEEEIVESYISRTSQSLRDLLREQESKTS